MLYLIQDGERVDIDHLPHETIVYLLMAGAEIKDSADLLSGQEANACQGPLKDPGLGKGDVPIF